MELTTDDLTFEYTGLKTMEDVMIVGSGLAQMQVCVEYSNNNGATFTTTDWRSMNSLGYIRIGVTAHQFRVKLRVKDFTGAEVIRTMKVGMKYTDRRFVKGVTMYGNKDVTRGN
jgi:DNA transposition AAA+ family ATPase